MRKFICALSCVTTLATTSPSGPALAATATGTLDVSITIAQACVVGTSAPVSFGSQDQLAGSIGAQGSIEVTCTTGTEYNIGLGAGSSAGASVDNRKMTSSTGVATVAYQLYRDSARNERWGETVGTDTLVRTGTGSAQQFPVYGSVTSQATPAAGTYSDAVTFTVTY
jgi:spore coat protein U-like protein